MISIKDNRIRWAISAVLALLILFGTYRNVFSVAAFLLMGLMLVFCNRETNLLQIFFIMPMANIFKLSPGTQSFFTIIILVYIVLHLVLPRRATLLVILLGLYVLTSELWTGQFNLFRTIKFVCNLLFLSSMLNGEVKLKHKEVFFSYIIGNIVASFWGQMDSGFFKIQSYVELKELGGPYSQGEAIYRFAGLYEDPNYYSVGLIVSLCLLLVLNHRKEIKTSTMLFLTAPLFYFIIITYSKSAFAMFVVLVLFFLYSLYKRKKYASIISTIVTVVLVLVLALSGLIDFFDVIVNRLMETVGPDADINSATTGRFDLWVMYISYLINNYGVSLFGSGISAALLNGWGSHNTYIDILYYLGFFGGFLLFATLYAISVQSVRLNIKRNILNYSVLICIFTMYFFLGELFYFDPPFQLSLAFLVLNLPLNNTSENIQEFEHKEEFV